MRSLPGMSTRTDDLHLRRTDKWHGKEPIQTGGSSPPPSLMSHSRLFQRQPDLRQPKPHLLLSPLVESVSRTQGAVSPTRI